jgi:hypothetical protein
MINLLEKRFTTLRQQIVAFTWFILANQHPFDCDEDKQWKSDPYTIKLEKLYRNEPGFIDTNLLKQLLSQVSVLDLPTLLENMFQHRCGRKMSKTALAAQTNVSWTLSPSLSFLSPSTLLFFPR